MNKYHELALNHIQNIINRHAVLAGRIRLSGMGAVGIYFMAPQKNFSALCAVLLLLWWREAYAQFMEHYHRGLFEKVIYETDPKKILDYTVPASYSFRWFGTLEEFLALKLVTSYFGMIVLCFLSR